MDGKLNVRFCFEMLTLLQLMKRPAKNLAA